MLPKFGGIFTENLDRDEDTGAISRNEIKSNPTGVEGPRISMRRIKPKADNPQDGSTALVLGSKFFKMKQMRLL
ncbi:hypothetical protein M5689_006582 [Euphorbia peplus]|nr:hypothetical protein M5689_006582 [Euphorbia peplus]